VIPWGYNEETFKKTNALEPYMKMQFYIPWNNNVIYRFKITQMMVQG
jgi:hypothetical protein